MPREALLARTLAELADTLVADFDVVDLFTLLADRCAELLDVDAAGLMLVAADQSLHVVASSNRTVHVLELFELEAQEGPCVECYATGQPVVSQDLAGDGTRWPRFADQALAAGIHAVHALPMRLRGRVIGALNLFHRTTGQMGPTDVAIAQALADVATIAVLQHRAVTEAQVLSDNLQVALNSRVVIEQAKGVLAERLGTGMSDAFELLRQHARRNNQRLTDVAQDVTDGTLSAADLRHRT